MSAHLCDTVRRPGARCTGRAASTVQGAPPDRVLQLEGLSRLEEWEGATLCFCYAVHGPARCRTQAVRLTGIACGAVQDSVGAGCPATVGYTGLYTNHHENTFGKK